MSSPYDYRYTDRDVREDPRLSELATMYLRSYGGDFEPIVTARNYLLHVGPLPTPMVRTVLNCMRHDKKVAGQMPAPRSAMFDIEDVVKPDPIRPDPAPRVRYPFDLKVKWKKKYYAATHKQASAYHLLSPEASVIRYWPAIGKYRALLKAYCGAELRTGVLLDTPPPSRHECKACVRHRDEQNVRNQERKREAERMGTQ